MERKCLVPFVSRKILMHCSYGIDICYDLRAIFTSRKVGHVKMSDIHVKLPYVIIMDSIG